MHFDVAKGAIERGKSFRTLVPNTGYATIPCKVSTKYLDWECRDQQQSPIRGNLMRWLPTSCQAVMPSRVPLPRLISTTQVYAFTLLLLHHPSTVATEHRLRNMTSKLSASSHLELQITRMARHGIRQVSSFYSASRWILWGNIQILITPIKSQLRHNMIKLNPRGHFRENRCRGYSGYGTFVTRLVRDFGCGVRHEVFCVLRAL